MSPLKPSEEAQVRQESQHADAEARRIMDEADKRPPETDDRTEEAVVDEEAPLGPESAFRASDVDLFGITKGKLKRLGAIQPVDGHFAVDLEMDEGQVGYVVIGVSPRDSHAPRVGDRVLLSESATYIQVSRWGRRIGLVPVDCVIAVMGKDPTPPDPGEVAVVEVGKEGNTVPGTPDGLEPTSGLTPAQREAEAMRRDAAVILSRSLKDPRTDPEEIDGLIERSGGFPLTPEAAPGRTLPQVERGDER